MPPMRVFSTSSSSRDDGTSTCTAQPQDAAASVASRPCTSSFSSVQPELSMRELLAPHVDLAQYYATFEEAQISPGLAADLSTQELAALLPVEAPLGHALRLRRIFADETRPRPRIPASSAWQMTGRRLALGMRDDSLLSDFKAVNELTVIGASLMLSVCLPVLMFNLPTECADGTSCDGLRTANAVLWSAVAVFFLMAVVQSYILLVVVLSVAPEHLAQWQEDHRYFTHSPTGLFIMGLTTMYIALGLHMFISLDATYTMQVRYTVCGIILVCSFAFGWVYWALVSKRTFGVRWRDWVVLSAGAIGFYLPQKQMSANGARANTPYF